MAHESNHVTLPSGIREIMRTPQVLEIVGCSTVHLLRLEKANKFPKRFKIHEGGRACGWWTDEVRAWQRKRDESRRPAIGLGENSGRS